MKKKAKKTKAKKKTAKKSRRKVAKKTNVAREKEVLDQMVRFEDQTKRAKAQASKDAFAAYRRGWEAAKLDALRFTSEKAATDKGAWTLVSNRTLNLVEPLLVSAVSSLGGDPTKVGEVPDAFKEVFKALGKWSIAGSDCAGVITK